MTSSGHVTSSGSCPIVRPWPHSYRLSIGTIQLSGFVSEIFYIYNYSSILTAKIKKKKEKEQKKLLNYFVPKLRQRLLRDDVINDVIIPVSTIRDKRIDMRIQEHCVKISSNSDNNCRRRSILKKNDDVTIMTSSGHVTSSVTCPIDRPRLLSYRLSIGTILLSGFVSEIFSAKVATTIITWWRHQGPPSWIWCNRKYVQSMRRPRKPYPRIKHEVDRTIRCRDMAIWNANLMTSLMTSQGPDQKFVKKNYFTQVGDHRVKISAQSAKNWRRRSILKKNADRQTNWQPDNLTNWQSHKLDWQ